MRCSNNKLIIAAVLCSVSGLFASAGPADALGTCAICFEEFTPQDTIVHGNDLFQNCDVRHVFHERCMTTWMLAALSPINDKAFACPLCRGSLRTGSLIIPLVNAIGRIDVVQLQVLLGQAPEIEKRFAGGLGLILAARYEEYVDAARILLDNGVPADFRLASGATVLTGAALYRNEAMVRLLLSHGASANIAEIYTSNNSLMAAADSGDATIVALLIDGGAAVDACNSGGETALIIAVQSGYAGAAAILLAHHADAQIRDVLGKAALDYAQPYPEIVALLRAHGAY